MEKLYILDAVIGGVPMHYSFCNRTKLDEYIGFLHERTSELKCTLEYQIKEETSMIVGH